MVITVQDSGQFHRAKRRQSTGVGRRMHVPVVRCAPAHRQEVRSMAHQLNRRQLAWLAGGGAASWSLARASQGAAQDADPTEAAAATSTAEAEGVQVTSPE